MVTLREWLQAEKKDYGIGLALLGKYSKNRVLLQNLSRKQNPAKVEYELNKAAKQLGIDIDDVEESKDLSGGKDTTVQPQKIEGTSRSHTSADMDKLIVIRSNQKVNYEDLPKEIQEKWDENRDGYKEIRATHEKLKLMEAAPAEDRVPLLARIDELDIAIRKNWDVIDAWQPGAEPEVKKEAEAIDHKRINANRKYISTNAKKLAEETDQVKADKLRAKIQERVTELKVAGEEMNDKTREELKILGIEC